jgi:large subunit ribosomal protein L2
MVSVFFSHSRYFNSKVRLLLKRLTIPKVELGGRNSSGRITVRHRVTNRCFSRCVLIDYSRVFFILIPGLIINLNYLNHKKFFNLIVYDNGYTTLSPAIDGISEGDVVISSFDFSLLDYGSLAPIGFFSPGSIFNTVTFSSSIKHAFSCSAGSFSKSLKSVGPNLLLIELPSGEKRLVAKSHLVISGRISALGFFRKSIRKAGDRYKSGFRPSVRGVAMNPVDHPHGGGQGRTSGGRPSVTPWGVYTKGKKTSSRRSRRTLNFYLYN